MITNRLNRLSLLSILVSALVYFDATAVSAQVECPPPPNDDPGDLAPVFSPAPPCDCDPEPAPTASIGHIEGTMELCQVIIVYGNGLDIDEFDCGYVLSCANAFPWPDCPPVPCSYTFYVQDPSTEIFGPISGVDFPLTLSQIGTYEITVCNKGQVAHWDPMTDDPPCTEDADEVCAMVPIQVGCPSASVVLDKNQIAMCEIAHAGLFPAPCVGVKWRTTSPDIIAIDENSGVITPIKPGQGSLEAFALGGACKWNGSITVKGDSEGGGCAGSSCGGSSAAGSGGAVTGSLNVWINLGRGERGESAGAIGLYQKEPSELLCTPDLLSYPVQRNDIVTMTTETGVLRQVKTLEALADIVVIDEYSYEVRFYSQGTRESEEDLYEPEGSAFVTWLIENPDHEPEYAYNRLKVTRFVGSTPQVSYLFEGEIASEDWELTISDEESDPASVVRREAVTWTTSGSERTRSYNVAGANNTVVYRRDDVYTTLELDLGAEGTVERELLTESVIDPESADLHTTYQYYLEVPGKVGKTKSVQRHDGSWELWDYDSSGRPITIIKPWLSEETYSDTPNLSKCVLTTYSYTTNDSELDDLSRESSKPRAVTQTQDGDIFSRTYFTYIADEGGNIDVIKECVEPAATYASGSNLVTTKTYIVGDDERPASIVYPDGRKETFDYEIGYRIQDIENVGNFTFSEESGGNEEQISITEGTVASPSGIASKTTKSTRISNLFGIEVARETWVYTGSGYERIDWTVLAHDSQFRSTHVYTPHGDMEATTWGCCQPEQKMDSEGVVTEYEFDIRGNLKSMTRQLLDEYSGFAEQAAITTTHTYDAYGRRLTETISSGTPTIGTSTVYDRAGRVVEEIDAAELSTTYGYVGLTTTTNLPGDAQRIVERYVDGRTKKISGNGQIEQHYTYGVNNDGTTWVKITVGSEESTRYTKTTYDLLGRPKITERPAFGSGTITETTDYDTGGRVIKVTSSVANRPAQIRAYDDLGNLIWSGLDVDDSNSLTLESMDQVTGTDVSYSKVGDHWWQVSTTTVYPTDDDDTPVVASVISTKLTGLAENVISYSVSKDVHTNEFIRQTTVDRENHLVTESETSPASSETSYAYSRGGRIEKSSDFAGLVQKFTYDALGRRLGVVDSQGRTSSAHYNSLGQVDYADDTDGNRTWFYYDEVTGRRIAVENSEHLFTRFEFDDAGRVTKTWGDVPQPTEIGYNDFGERVSLKTYRGGDAEDWDNETWPETPGTADETTWTFDPTTGLLTSKEYADETEVTYDYYASGQLETREWDRGTTATYSYHEDTGALTSINYSDDTHDITLTHDRLGRTKTVIDAVGTRTFYYNSTLQLESESVAGSGQMNDHDFLLTRKYSTTGLLGRYKSFGIGPDSGGWDDDYVMNYGFNGFGQLDSVNGTALPPGGVKYTYKVDSNLIEKVEYLEDAETAIAETTRSFEENRDVLTSVENKWLPGTPLTVSKYDYVTDVLGRRSSLAATVDTGEVFTPDVRHNRYTYNPRNELVEGHQFVGIDVEESDPTPVAERAFDYNYDNIGNRRWGELPSNYAIAYESNSVNQYSEMQTLEGSSSFDVTESDDFGQSSPGTNDWMGTALAISGSRMVVAASYETVSSVPSGAVHMFAYSGGSWSQTHELVGSDAASGDRFGYSVALDGDVALVGSIYHDHSSISNSGSAYAYRLVTGSWNVAELLAPSSPQANDYFGCSVALNGDYAFVGAYGRENGVKSDAGAVYIFHYDGTEWDYVSTLTPSDAEAGDSFGYSLASDGDWLLIGAMGDDTTWGSNTGSAYAYKLVSGTWTYVHKIYPSTTNEFESGDYFGYSISMSGDLAIISSPYDDDQGNDSGSAYLFSQSSDTWSDHAKMKPEANSANNYFGMNSAIICTGLFSDCGSDPVGATLLISDPYDDDDGTSSGSAYLFTWTADGLRFNQKLHAGDATLNDQFGLAVGLTDASGDVHGIVSAPNWEASSNYNHGRLYEFDGVTGQETEGFAYDTDGNLIADHDLTYEYDAENRLIAISPTVPEEGDLRTEMFYDYMGRRVRKVIREWVLIAEPPISVHPEGDWGWGIEGVVDDMRYVYDGWNLVIEKRLADRHSVEDFTELTVRKFAWGCDLAGLNGGAATGNVQSAVHGAGGIGGLLAMEDLAYEHPYAEDPKLLYFYDGNGNVMQMVVHDDGGAVANTPPPLFSLLRAGLVSANYEYDPYGGTLLAADSMGVDNPFRFSTKFYDAQPNTAAAGERGLYYYGYRYYSPRLGRWLNRDPIEDASPVVRTIGRQRDRRRPPHSANALYTFCWNGPTFQKDPLGLDPMVICSDPDRRPPLMSSDPNACQYPNTARYSANFWMKEDKSDKSCRPCGIEFRLSFGIFDKPFWMGEEKLQKCTRRVSWPISCVCKKMGDDAMSQCMRGCIQCVYDNGGGVPNDNAHFACGVLCAKETGGSVSLPADLHTVINACAQSEGCLVGDGHNSKPSPDSAACKPFQRSSKCKCCNYCP